MKIKADDVFIYPTDTVWGIGCNLYSEIGHSEIIKIKKSLKNKPLTIMFASVEDVYNFCHFPKEMTLSWLKDFFKLETTLGIPANLSKIKIPHWATGESEFISIRSLDTDVVKKIYDNIKAPFFSTSLNLSGLSPIVSNEDARKFQKEHAKNAHFIESKEKHYFSGSSSTIVFFSQSLDFEIKREGQKIEEVKKHLKKLFIDT